MTFQVPPQCLQKCFFPFDGHADQLLFSLTRHFSRSATTLCAETARAACPPALSAGTTSGGGRPSGTSSRRGRCWGEAHERRNDCQNCEEDEKNRRLYAELENGIVHIFNNTFYLNKTLL